MLSAFLFCLMPACLPATHAVYGSASPLGAGAVVPADKCRAMDGQLTLTPSPSRGYHETKSGPCDSDITFDKGVTEFSISTRPDAGMRGLPVSAGIYYSSKIPLSVYFGPSAWLGVATTETAQSVTLPPGEDRVFVQGVMDSKTEDTYSPASVAVRIRPNGQPGSTLEGVVLHGVAVYKFAMPKGTPVMQSTGR
jgi:hypothetical protein